jgi:hypothetical protein
MQDFVVAPFLSPQKKKIVNEFGIQFAKKKK